MARQLSDEEILAYKHKEVTPVQERFADWLVEKLDIDFPNSKAEAAFREAVRLATALRMIFQASSENQEARTESRSERQEAKASKASRAAATPPEEPEEEAPPVKAVKAAKASAKKSAKATAAKADDDENGGDTAVAPAAKPSAPKKASARSGKPAPF